MTKKNERTKYRHEYNEEQTYDIPRDKRRERGATNERNDTQAADFDGYSSAVCVCWRSFCLCSLDMWILSCAPPCAWWLWWLW